MLPTLFRRSVEAGDPLYYLQREPDAGDSPGPCIALWPGQQETADALSLDQAWRLARPVFLFLASKPSMPEAFLEQLKQYLQYRQSPAAGTELLWIANPEAPSKAWTTSRIWAVSETSAPGQTTDGPVKRVTARLSMVMLRNLALSVEGGCELSLGDDNQSFQLRSIDHSDAGFYLSANAGRSQLRGMAGPLRIGFAGPLAGAFTFAMTLDNQGAIPDLDKLDACLRFFRENPEQPGTGILNSYRFPVFCTKENPAISLDVSLDPLSPLMGDRSFFALTAGQRLASLYRTRDGRKVILAPAPGEDPSYAPKLVFSVRSLHLPPRPEDPLYLVPSGRFRLEVDDERSVSSPASGTIELQCGLSGVEYFRLQPVPEEDPYLYFVPGQPAYMPSGSAEGLRDDADTSWVFVENIGESVVSYFAQPEQSILYTETADAFLGYKEICTGILPRTFQGKATSFPMVPFAGVEITEAETGRYLETAAIGPERQRRISAMASDPVDMPGGTAVTPYGLTLTWEPELSILLGQARDGQYALKLNHAVPPLTSALLSNQLFLVIGSKAKLKQSAELAGSLLPIGSGGQDWFFDVFGEQSAIDGWNRHGTLLILKYGDQSLASLAAETSAWTRPDDFNDDAGATRSALLSIIEDARKRMAEGEDALSHFVRDVIDNRFWNGVLVLRCSVPMDKLPTQISGIAPGLDPDLFYAHHLGISMTPVETKEGRIRLGDSSLFGLIDYRDEPDLAYAGSPYNFKVKSLQVRFSNSAVADFKSRIELLATEWFGDPATLPNSDNGSNLILNGVYQKHGDEGSYLFTLQQPCRFDSESGVLNAVFVDRVQFVSVTTPDLAEARSIRAMSRFLFWGSIDFKAMPGFDLFSFGEPGRLAFSGLSIDMYFDPKDPRQHEFRFNASSVTLDEARSEARDHSLFRGFPLKLTGFAASKDHDDSPAKQGFLQVDIPVGQSSLNAPWFGLTAELQLGTAGALAAKAGFTAELLAAWRPGEGGPNLFVGLKLPGTGSGTKTLSLQGILKLKVGRMALDLTEDGGYVLSLNQITLSLLGLTFPSSGQTQALLYGDPSGKDNTTLAWYGGYAKDRKKTDKSMPEERLTIKEPQQEAGGDDR